VGNDRRDAASEVLVEAFMKQQGTSLPRNLGREWPSFLTPMPVPEENPELGR
jgi:hypothetical protein